MENAPDLPPVSKHVFEVDDYAEEALRTAIRKGSKKKRKKKHHHKQEASSYHFAQDASDDSFIQRDAVVETLISHYQIPAPLLTLFPLAWQRAMLGNVITLIAAVISGKSIISFF